ncbi:hypothetical protein R1sor_001257 [Riccia sorocarpa]|uniref:Uncharacterized protein n=1 Tax=Riccia sorocarpa TaxID=122646 RepID=A0ABD3GVG0_9MARC
MEAMYALLVEVSKEAIQVRTVMLTLQSENKRMQEMVTEQSATFKEQLKVLKETPAEPAPVTLDLKKALTSLESKMHSMVVTSRETQMEVMREQTKENEMQYIRRKNLRIAGLEETTDEVVLETVSEFFKETLRVSSPVVESARRLGKNSDRGPRPSVELQICTATHCIWNYFRGTGRFLPCGDRGDVCRGITSIKSEMSDLRFDFRKLSKRFDEHRADFTQKLEKVLKDEHPPIVPDFEKVFSEMDTKLRSYAEVARESQLTLLKEQELGRMAQLEKKMQERDKELADRSARRLNLRLVGMPEQEGEDVMAAVLQLYKEDLKVADPQVLQAVRVGRAVETHPRVILCRFKSVESLNVATSNRGLLKGRNLWLDPDLTPSQVEDRRQEVKKVRDAVASGVVAYLRDGKAVITSKRRET